METTPSGSGKEGLDEKGTGGVRYMSGGVLLRRSCGVVLQPNLSPRLSRRLYTSMARSETQAMPLLSTMFPPQDIVAKRRDRLRSVI